MASDTEVQHAGGPVRAECKIQSRGCDKARTGVCRMAHGARMVFQRCVCRVFAQALERVALDPACRGPSDSYAGPAHREGLTKVWRQYTSSLVLVDTTCGRCRCGRGCEREAWKGQEWPQMRAEQRSTRERGRCEVRPSWCTTSRCGRGGDAVRGRTGRVDPRVPSSPRPKPRATLLHALTHHPALDPRPSSTARRTGVRSRPYCAGRYRARAM
jgi:hypothetical protein